MGLFTVELRNVIVVVADDESHAYSVARDHRVTACMDGDPEFNVIGPVTSAKELPRDWDALCLPYGGDGNTTIGEILEK